MGRENNGAKKGVPQNQGRKPSIMNILDPSSAHLSLEKAKEKATITNLIKTGELKENTLTAPSYLTKEGKKEWNALMKLYKKMSLNILDELDIQAISSYVEAKANWKAGMRIWKSLVEKYGDNIHFLKREDQKNVDDLKKRIDNADSKMLSLSEVLCLSPIGRARMSIALANKGLKLDNPINKLLEDDEDEEG
jgi:P27 family predicted phage terminase small subunit